MKYAICLLLALSLSACSHGKSMSRSSSVATHSNINNPTKHYIRGKLQQNYKSKIMNYCPAGQLQKVGAKCQ